MELKDGKISEEQYYIKTKKQKNKEKQEKIKQKKIKPKKKPLIIRFFLAIIKLILIFIILALVACIPVIYYLGEIYHSTDEEFVNLLEQMNQTSSQSYVIDISGNVIAELNGDEKRKVIDFDEMSKYLPLAYIAIEDERFIEHQGVDLKRTAAAIYSYLKNEGDASFGGSSITQQLIKNITGEKDRTVKRKIKEWMLAYKLELHLSKKEILEEYLNLIFVGSDVYGVEMGSKYYFGKSASDLSLAESAFLAGITNQPNYYNPFDTEDNSEKIANRTKTVLNKMRQLEFINEEVYNKAIKEVDKGLKFKKTNIENKIYSYHTDELINQVIEDIAKEKNVSIEYATNYVYSGGLKIYSTQDTTIQKTLETEFKKKEYILKSKNKKGETSQAAMVIIDHTNGFVVGCVGGLGEKTTYRGLNRATQSTRQTGSAMKPIAVLAPAMQEGLITPDSVYTDVRTTFKLNNGELYTPKNYNYYRGWITVRQALETSQNIPFVKIMEELTVEKSREYLEKMGITTLTDKDYGLSLAIGGLHKGISPLEMAGAYATIANNGVYKEPIFYTKVTDASGETILLANQEKKRVFTKKVDKEIKQLLKQPVEGYSGTARYCKIDGIDVAAKTGTTDDDYDRWLCGFTPYYTAACWFGYDYNETVIYNGNPAGVIWSNVMKKIHVGLENAEF